MYRITQQAKLMQRLLKTHSMQKLSYIIFLTSFLLLLKIPLKIFIASACIACRFCVINIKVTTEETFAVIVLEFHIKEQFPFSFVGRDQVLFLPKLFEEIC